MITIYQVCLRHSLKPSLIVASNINKTNIINIIHTFNNMLHFYIVFLIACHTTEYNLVFFIVLSLSLKHFYNMRIDVFNNACSFFFFFNLYQCEIDLY